MGFWWMFAESIKLILTTVTFDPGPITTLAFKALVFEFWVETWRALVALQPWAPTWLVGAVCSLWNLDPDLQLAWSCDWPDLIFSKMQVVVSYRLCLFLSSWSCVFFLLLLRTLTCHQDGPYCCGFLIFLSVVWLREKHILQEDSSWLCFVNCTWHIKHGIIFSLFLAFTKNFVFLKNELVRIILMIQTN